VHVLSALGRCDDLGVLDQAIAQKMIGVRMRVEQPVDAIAARHLGERVEHFARQVEPHQRVDEQGLSLRRD